MGLYAEILGCSDAQARDQLRDYSGLESALARPASYAHYEHADVALQLAALHTFLLVNGLQIDASQEERARWILDLAASGRTAEEKVRELTARLRQSTVPHPDEVDEGEV